MNSHLRARTQFISSLLRLQSRVLHALSSFFHDREIHQVLPPILTSSDCEGAGETFGIQNAESFFGQRTNLIVSSQLHLEALAMGLGKVWTIVPTFRAEKSLTARHLAEFRMIEAEVCFTHSLHDVMDIVESMVKHLTSVVSLDKDLTFLRTLSADGIETTLDIEARWQSILDAPFIRIEYSEAVQILQSAQDNEEQFVFHPQAGMSLQAEHEKYLAAHFRRPVFVTHYPASQKPFYMLPGEGGTVECFDLLVPSMGELCGGSLRNHDLTSLEAAMRSAGVEEASMRWYTDTRRYGTVKHGGFGIGWERLIGYLCGVSNVREIAAFPRWVNHCVA